jgi:hypothetical protein
MFEKGTYVSGDEVERADATRMKYDRVLCFSDVDPEPAGQ